MLNSATVSANICTSRYIQELRNLTFPSSHQTKKGRERYLPLNIPWRLPVQDGLVWPDVVAVPWVVVRVGRGVVWNHSIAWIPVRDFHLHSFHRGIHLLQSTPQFSLCASSKRGNVRSLAPLTVSRKSRNPNLPRVNRHLL